MVSVFVKSGEVPNCVNLAKRTPAKCQLIVRHYDRVGVLAFVLEQIRARGINVEEVQNIIFDGAAAASCRIQLMEEPAADVLAAIKSGNPDIISVEAIRLDH